MCESTTKKGTKCKNKPTQGTKFCYLHQPKIPKEPSKKKNLVVSFDELNESKEPFLVCVKGILYYIITVEQYYDLVEKSEDHSDCGKHIQSITIQCCDNSDEMDKMKARHERKCENIRRESTKYKTKLDKIKKLYSDSLNNITSLKKSLKDSNRKLNDIQKELSETRKNNNITRRLTDFEILDDYVNSKVQQQTGTERNYSRHIYNSIHDFLRLNNAEDMIKDQFEVSASEFKDMFLNVRNKRRIVAHPPVVNLSEEKKTERIKHLLGTFTG